MLSNEGIMLPWKEKTKGQDETVQSYIWRWYWVSSFLSNSCLVSLYFSTRRWEEIEFWLSFSRAVFNAEILFLISSCKSIRSETSTSQIVNKCIGINNRIICTTDTSDQRCVSCPTQAHVIIFNYVIFSNYYRSQRVSVVSLVHAMLMFHSL
jgi:hypothetical protein